MPAAVPVIEIADDAHASCVRRPDGKACAADTLHFQAVRAQGGVNAHVRTLAEQVQVDVAERRREPVRVFELAGFAGWQRYAEAIAADTRWHLRGEYAFLVYPVHGAEHIAAGTNEPGRCGLRLHRPNDAPARFAMDAEHGEWIIVAAVDERIEFGRESFRIIAVLTHTAHRCTAWPPRPR